MSQPKRVKDAGTGDPGPTLEELASQLEKEYTGFLSSSANEKHRESEDELSSLVTSLCERIEDPEVNVSSSRTCASSGSSSVRSCQYHYDTFGKLKPSKRSRSGSLKQCRRQKKSSDLKHTSIEVGVEIEGK